MIHISYDFLLHLEEAEKECWKTYLEGAQKINDNPLGIHFSTIGRSTAYLVKVSSSLFFNKTLGFGIEHLEYLDPLFEFYHANDKACTVELIPSPEDDTILETLARSGLYNCGSSIMLYRPIEEKIPISNPKIKIEHVPKENTKVLADMHVAGFEFHGDDAEQEYTIVEQGYKNDNFHCFIAKTNSSPIGAGSLFVFDDIGVLFGGATIPKQRGKGGQKALLEHRINKAYELGCRVLISHTPIYSASQRNLERLGFHLASFRNRWTEYPY